MPANELFTDAQWPMAITEQYRDKIKPLREELNEGVFMVMPPFTRASMSQMHAVMLELEQVNGQDFGGSNHQGIDGYPEPKIDESRVVGQEDAGSRPNLGDTTSGPQIRQIFISREIMAGYREMNEGMLTSLPILDGY